MIEYPNILMGRNNPNGWKLESLLEQLANEVREKTKLIENSDHPLRDTIIENNNGIITHLNDAIALQKETYAKLDAHSPNEGPYKPRL